MQLALSHIFILLFFRTVFPGLSEIVLIKVNICGLLDITVLVIIFL